MVEMLVNMGAHTNAFKKVRSPLLIFRPCKGCDVYPWFDGSATTTSMSGVGDQPSTLQNNCFW